MSKVSVAVAGGGIFGVTAAIYLARRGYAVTLYEKNGDILQGASGINQYRLHRGYHYPRSVDTARSAQDGEVGFRAEYGEAVLDGGEHFYCIAREGSKTSGSQYLDFCRNVGLEHTLVDNLLVRREAVELCILATESLFDPETLRRLCWQKLRALPVTVQLNTVATPRRLAKHDFVVIATYSDINSLLGDFPDAQREYQYELCEKPVVRLPRSFDGKSIVVMDGPFMSLDPLGRSGLFLLGNVVHAIHGTDIGKTPRFDEQFTPLLNQGIVRNPAITRFPQFIASGREFLPGLAEAEHLGSMFTIRTVLPYRDDTDERPTVVRRAGDRTIVLFSGKISTCVDAARQVVEEISREAAPAASGRQRRRAATA